MVTTGKIRKRGWLLVGAVTLALLGWYLLGPDVSSDPIIDGKRLSVWIKSCAAEYIPTHNTNCLPAYVDVFRKAGQPGVQFLGRKLTETSSSATKYVQFKSDSPQWLFKIMPTVNPGDWQQKECAAIILGELGPSASNTVEALVQSLDFTEVHETDKSTGASNGKSWNSSVRAQSVHSLALIAPDSPLAIDALVKTLLQKEAWMLAAVSGGKKSVATCAEEELAQIKPKFKDRIPTMIANLKYQDQREFRGAGIEAAYPVGSLAPGYGETVPRLIPVLNDLDPDTRDAAAYDLGMIRREDKGMAAAALPALVEALNDSDARVRIRVSETILKIDPKQIGTVLPMLINLMAETNYTIRLRTVDLMRQADSNSAAAILIMTKSLQDDSSTVRIWARDALDHIQPGLKTGAGIE